jgi:UDP-galactopyranose mutase
LHSLILETLSLWLELEVFATCKFIAQHEMHTAARLGIKKQRAGQRRIMSNTDKSPYRIARNLKQPGSSIIADNENEFETCEESFDDAPDLICLSHLRWDFVYQRPQHLLSRCARERRVFFVEEPVFGNDQMAYIDMKMRESGVCLVVPHLPSGLSQQEVNAVLRLLIDDLLSEARIRDYLLWYYTPMAMQFTRHLNPLAVIYDCMDELSAFKFAPPALKQHEEELLARADVVFTGGQSLFETKRHQHPNIHPFPSSIDAAHFAQARTIAEDPADQANIPHPRMGFFGVIDERMDIALLDRIAIARPDWHLVMVGPVVKIDPQDLPNRPNIHYLGGKEYKELPAYIAGWDVALLPFAINESTRFISPTKTPEYLAAGKQVVSTPIRDVVRPYGDNKLVSIAETEAEFISAIEAALEEKENQDWLLEVDQFLAQISWDQTWLRMMRMIESALSARHSSAAKVAQTSPVKEAESKSASSLSGGD